MFDLTPFDTRSRRTMFDLLNDFDKRFLGSNTLSAFSTDIMEDDDKFVLQAELPGFSKDEIKIDLSEDRLTISAQHDSETSSDSAEASEESKSDDNKVNYIHKERVYGRYSRSFHISNIDTEHIAASYQNGVLELTLPKQKPVVPPSRKIEIQ